MSFAGSAESITQTARAQGQIVKKMKTKKLPIPVNWARPNWNYAAAGIRCRADWKGAQVYHTEVGWIIAYTEAHANDKAAEVLLDRESEDETMEAQAQLWETAE